jgi:hypothetical protein
VRARVSQSYVFPDDFSDGIGTKSGRNPVLVRSQDWEKDYICVPNLLFEDGLHWWGEGTPPFRAARCQRSGGRSDIMDSGPQFR